MKVAGIVAEYNPFHNGHKYQIDTLKTSGFSHIVVAMSGNFVQRGDSAIIDKWSRTKAALLNGADLVLEIPTCYAIAPAEKFAFGAISTLNSTGIIDSIAFGSETGDLKNISKAVDSLFDNSVDLKIKDYLKDGVTFAVARENAIKQFYGEKISNVFKNPNDILATEYLRALKTINSKIGCFAIKRKGVFHDDFKTEENIASASKIRQLIVENKEFKNFVPENAYDIYMSSITSNQAPALLTNAESAILWQLRQMSSCDFERLSDVSEGFHNRINNVAVKNGTRLNEIYELAKTKRYTLSRIKRLIINAALSIFSYEMPPYIRVLGFTDKGEELLTKIKVSAEKPIITSLSNAKSIGLEAENYFSTEAKYTDFYTLLMPKPLPTGEEYRHGIVKI